MDDSLEVSMKDTIHVYECKGSTEKQTTLNTYAMPQPVVESLCCLALKSTSGPVLRRAEDSEVGSKLRRKLQCYH